MFTSTIPSVSNDFIKIIIGATTLFAGPFAFAAPTTTPLGCGGVFNEGGCPPYAQITYYTPGGASVFEYDESVLNVNFSGDTANVAGKVDMTKGQLDIFAGGINDNNPSTGVGGIIGVSAVDVFTLHRESGTGPVTFSATLLGQGVGRIDTLGYSETISVQLGFVGGATASDGGTFQGGNNATILSEYPWVSTVPGRTGYPLSAMFSETLDPEIPFAFAYTVRADVSESAYLTGSAFLNFQLPEGVTITSMSGYISPVPEAETWVLFGWGLAGIAFVTRKMRRRELHTMNASSNSKIISEATA